MADWSVRRWWSEGPDVHGLVLAWGVRRTRVRLERPWWAVVMALVITGGVGGVAGGLVHPGGLWSRALDGLVGALVTIVLLVIAIFVWSVMKAPFEQRNALREEVRALRSKTGALTPVLKIETRSGEPWDDPRYGEKTRYITKNSTVRDIGIVMKEYAGVPYRVRDPLSPAPADPPPVPDHFKRISVTNAGDEKAPNCRGNLTGNNGMGQVVRLRWDNPEGPEERTLAPGEHDFLFLPGKEFPAEGDYDTVLTLFVEGASKPSVFNLRFRIEKNSYPICFEPEVVT